MFLDEARLAARIRHPNVVSTIDIQKTTDSLFIVMDYVDGPTLQEIRKHLKGKGEQLPLGIAVRIILDILNGLQEAHELLDEDGNPLNLVHRDVSPHNVLIGTDGVAQLTDFGVAKAEARISSTRGGQLKGKIAYMPPEQILTEPVTRAADVYSAAVCFWEAIVGKRLFRAPNDGAMVHMILEGQVESPSIYVDDVDPMLEAVLMKALSRRAEDRYAEALDFADALEDAARGAGVKIPRAREVGKFIKAIKEELGEARISSRSLTPPSTPSAAKPLPRANRPAPPAASLAPNASPALERRHAARPDQHPGDRRPRRRAPADPRHRASPRPALATVPACALGARRRRDGPGRQDGGHGPQLEPDEPHQPDEPDESDSDRGDLHARAHDVPERDHRRGRRGGVRGHRHHRRHHRRAEGR